MSSLIITFFQCPTNEISTIIGAAIAAGYRHFDCAHAYSNEAAIGDALKAIFEVGIVKREDLFITSKVRNYIRKYKSI